MGRVLAGLLGTLLVLAVLGGAILLLQSRDNAEVAAPSGPGEAVPGRCPAHPALVPRDARPLSRDQLLHAVALGNVVLAYGGERPPAALRELQDELSGRYDAEVAAAGLAVILARQQGTDGVVAVAWRHRLRVPTPGDTRLREFAEAWLGDGAPRPCRESA
ncbi:MAG TPA: DUF3105 domain-containing protein [Solirubrobacteraceae bacterium]|nr:DUF3105 domain-containing protein [Solirubrobacteraceae bacterium]